MGLERVRQPSWCGKVYNKASLWEFPYALENTLIYHISPYLFRSFELPNAWCIFNLRWIFFPCCYYKLFWFISCDNYSDWAVYVFLFGLHQAQTLLSLHDMSQPSFNTSGILINGDNAQARHTTVILLKGSQPRVLFFLGFTKCMASRVLSH